jgi:antagonist of KipI
MSLRIIKAGVLDTVQDPGRYGFQYLGINPGGSMDRFSSQAANMLVGNAGGEAVMEIHFPASVFLFEQETMIALAGADFSASINGENIPLWQPVILAKNSVLHFQKWKHGARCYLAVREKLSVSKWLNSYSLNLKAGCGGVNGRMLQKDDVIPLQERNDYKCFLNAEDFFILPWKADITWDETPTDRIMFFQGNEWNSLTEQSKNTLLNDPFTIGSLADRMGYRLQTKLEAWENGELVSAVVGFGTIQLLPNGELIILMADHQTTGGYPRIGHITSAHLPLLAQKQSGDKIYFKLTSLRHAEELFFKQHQHLLQLQNACKFRLEKFFNAQH